MTAVGQGVSGHAGVWSVLTAAVHAGEVESVVAAHSGDALVCLTSRTLAPRVLSHLHDTFWPAVEAPPPALPAPARAAFAGAGL